MATLGSAPKTYRAVFVPDDEFPTWNVVLDDPFGTHTIAYHIKEEADALAVVDCLNDRGAKVNGKRRN